MSSLSVSPHLPTVSISIFPITRLNIYTDSLQIDPRKQNRSAASTFPSGMFTWVLAMICQQAQLFLIVRQHVRLASG